MFSRSERLDRALKHKVLKEGEKFFFEGVSLSKVALEDNSLPSRLSVSVSKKAAVLATGRNLIKRQVGHILKEQKIKPGYAISVLVSKNPGSQLEEKTLVVIKKANLLK